MLESQVNIRRRVVNLTPEEVQKKREIDRENQRHCRAKTKTYIKSLEKSVTELSCQLREAKEALEVYRQREIEGAASTPSLSSSAVTAHHEWLSDQCSLSTPTEEPDLPRIGGESTQNLDGSPFYLDPLLPDLPWQPLDFSTGITISSGAGIEPEFSFWDFSITDSIHMMPFFPNSPPHEATVLTAGENEMPTASWDVSEKTATTEIWQQLPLHITPTCKLDEVIIGTATSWRFRAEQRGHQDAELIEPVFPSISSLLNPTKDEDPYFPSKAARSHMNKTQPLSRIVAAQVGRSPVKTLPERIGFMYVLSHLIRWLVCQSKESYHAMPDYLKPTKLQRTVPHPAWVDTIVWPQARDDIIRNMDWSRFEELRWLTGPRLRVNWHFSNSETLIESADKRCVMLHPGFEKHLHKLENWTTSEPVGSVFPFLKPYCR